MLAAAALVGTVVTLTPSADAADPSAGSTSQTVAQPGGGYITTFIAETGDITKLFTMTPVTVTPVPATARQIIVNGETVIEHSAGVEVTPVDNFPKPAVDPELTLSPYEMLLALGADPADITQFQTMDDPPTQGNLVTAGKTLDWAEQGHQIGQPACLDQSFESGHGHVYGCDVTRRVATQGAVWFLTDTTQASGVMHDENCKTSCNHFTGLKFGTSYGSGNKIDEWAPGGTAEIGACETDTVSVSYHGASASSTSQQCPETFGLYGIGTQTFSTKWDGQGSGPSNGARGTHAVDGVYNGASANPYPSVYDTYWWTTCC